MDWVEVGGGGRGRGGVGVWGFVEDSFSSMMMVARVSNRLVRVGKSVRMYLSCEIGTNGNIFSPLLVEFRLRKATFLWFLTMAVGIFGFFGKNLIIILMYLGTNFLGVFSTIL